MADDDLPRYARFGALLIAANMSQIVSRQWVLMHEVVAGVLIALALALYRPARPLAGDGGDRARAGDAGNGAARSDVGWACSR